MNTIADLVNRVYAKLVTARVTFEEIAANHAMIEFGHRRYKISFAEQDRFCVYSVILVKPSMRYDYEKDSYSRWVEDVLNGKTRNDKGELV